MSKFDFDIMANDDRVIAVFNKEKYSYGEAFSKGVKELKPYTFYNDFYIRIGYVRYGFNSSDDGLLNGWNIDFNQTKRKAKNEVEVWIVECVENE